MLNFTVSDLMYFVWPTFMDSPFKDSNCHTAVGHVLVTMSVVWLVMVFFVYVTFVIRYNEDLEYFFVLLNSFFCLYLLYQSSVSGKLPCL